MTGGSYLSALAHLDVVSSTNTLPPLNVTLTRALPEDSAHLVLSFTPVAGWNYFVQSRASLATGQWQTVPGGPFNTGNVTLTNAAPTTFFRIQAQNGP